MAAESKTGCFLNFPKKSLSGQALPPPPPPPPPPPRREGFLLSARRIRSS